MLELTLPLKIISFVVFFHVISGTFASIAIGYGNVIVTVYREVGIPLLFLISLVISFVLSLQFISIIYGYVIAMILVCIFVAFYMREKFRWDILPIKRSRFKKELLKFSFPLIATTLAIIIYNWTDTLMLGRYEGAREVGIYNVSLTIVRNLHFVVGALEVMLLPIAGELYARQQFVELKRTFQIITKWGFMATVPVFFILFFFPEMTITFLFGERHIESAMSLRILSLGYMAKVFLGANFSVLMVYGMLRPIFYLSVLSCIMNLGLNYVFIKVLGYGVTGASVATAMSASTVVIIAAIILYKYCGINPITARYLKPLMSSGLMGILLYIAAKSLPFNIWLMPVYLVLFILGYFVLIPLTRSIEDEDVFLFEAISKRTGLEMRPIRKVINKFYNPHSS
jgi:O-antigen/teichoic acid export membrane protein